MRLQEKEPFFLSANLILVVSRRITWHLEKKVEKLNEICQPATMLHRLNSHRSRPFPPPALFNFSKTFQPLAPEISNHLVVQDNGSQQRPRAHLIPELLSLLSFRPQRRKQFVLECFVHH